MKALTIWQPWASAIAVAGKPVENRSWSAPRHAIGERIAIHAGARIQWVYERACVQAFPTEGRDLMVARFGKSVLTVPSPLLPRAAVVATARLTRCVRIGDPDAVTASPWFSGPYGWVLEDRVELAEPVPCRGAQGLWTLPADVEALVLDRQGSVAP